MFTYYKFFKNIEHDIMANKQTYILNFITFFLPQEVSGVGTKKTRHRVQCFVVLAGELLWMTIGGTTVQL